MFQIWINSLQIISRFDAASFGQWGEAKFEPEEAFLADLKAIPGVSAVETQTFTLETVFSAWRGENKLGSSWRLGIIRSPKFEVLEGWNDKVRKNMAYARLVWKMFNEKNRSIDRDNLVTVQL